MKLLMKHKYGFTLIEVLISLTIVSLAFAAIIKTVSQTLKDTYYLQEKILATMVAYHTVNEVRVGLLKLSEENFDLEKEKQVLNSVFDIKGYFVPTKNPRIQEIHIEVYRSVEPQKLVDLKSYYYEN